MIAARHHNPNDPTYISFIIPFCVIDKSKHLNIPDTWVENNYYTSVSTTIQVIRNINKSQVSGNLFEIILVDNSHNWPDIDLPNVKVVKGLQALTKEEILKHEDFTSHKGTQNLDYIDWNNDTMWASLAFHTGIRNSTGDWIILQHNDVFYHLNSEVEMSFENLIYDIETDKLSYISVDSKKISLLTYIINKKFFDKYIFEPKFIPKFGGMVDTKQVGLADAYFFISRRDFFDDYDVDWHYGDSNHGATLYCLENNLPYLHLGPYYDNPSYDTETSSNLNTYFYDGKPFVTHLKGGFSENKLSDIGELEKFKEVLDENN